jgi:hypothetical protein
MQKIDSQLQAQLEAARAEGAEHALPVIVTVSPDSDLDLLAENGLQIARQFTLLSAVSGTVRPADIDRIAQLDTVVRIEYDSPVQATG